MIRCTIELLPDGREEGKRTVGLVEIASTGVDDGNRGSYAVVLKKTPPFSGALRLAWKKGAFAGDQFISSVVECADDELAIAKVEGHPRQARGVYDLLYRALKACGLEARIPADQR